MTSIAVWWEVAGLMGSIYVAPVQIQDYRDVVRGQRQVQVLTVTCHELVNLHDQEDGRLHDQEDGRLRRW